jgi:hypothetical protein
MSAPESRAPFVSAQGSCPITQRWMMCHAAVPRGGPVPYVSARSHHDELANGPPGLNLAVSICDVL